MVMAFFAGIICGFLPPDFARKSQAQWVVLFAAQLVAIIVVGTLFVARVLGSLVAGLGSVAFAAMIGMLLGVYLDSRDKKSGK